jgi:hypothetical protein
MREISAAFSGVPEKIGTGLKKCHDTGGSILKCSVQLTGEIRKLLLGQAPAECKIDRKAVYQLTLLFRQKKIVYCGLFQTGKKEIFFIQKSIFHTAAFQCCYNVGVPYLGAEPVAAWTSAEILPDISRHHFNLAYTVLGSQKRKKRLKIGAPENLDLPPFQHFREYHDVLGVVDFQPFEKNAGIIECDFDVRMIVKKSQGRFVCFLIM